MCSKLSSFTESVLSERKRLRGKKENEEVEFNEGTTGAVETEALDADVVRWFKGSG